MPSTRPTVDPVLDILEELGYDFDELDGDGYKRSIREAIFKTHPDTGGKTADPEKFQILNEEFKKIRRGGPKPSDIKVKEKNTTISPAKFLPGTTFRPEDIESNESDDSSVANITVVDRLNNIAEALNVIGGLFKTQLNILQDQEEEDRLDEAEKKKKLRESKLEKKDDKKKKSLIKMPKPVTNFFDKLQRFFVNVALGAATLKFVEWFKDPANREKILAFTNFIKDNAKAIFITLAAIVALNFAASLIGILATLKLVSGILLNPIVLTILGSLAVGSFLKKLQIRAAGGKEMDAARLKEGKLEDKANELGVIIRGDSGIVYVNGVEKDVMEFGTEEQKAAFVKHQTEKKRLDGIKKSMDKEIRDANKVIDQSYKPEIKQTGLFQFGKKQDINKRALNEKAEKRNEIQSKYSDEILKSTTLSNTSSSISQKVGKKRTPNLINLGGKSKGSSPNPTFSTGGQIEGVSSVDNSNIDLYSSSLSYGLTGAN